MELLKLLNVNELVVQILNFFLVLMLLRAFMWKRLLKVLDDRKERIASEFKKIEDTKQEVARIKTDYEAKVASIEQEAKRRIQEGIEEARRKAEDIRSQAQKDAQDIIENAKLSMRHELANARLEMRKELVDLTVLATENLIEEKLTEEDDKKIIEDFLRKIDTTL